MNEVTTYNIEFTEDDITSLISFILNHEREDIPDSVWEALNKMRDGYLMMSMR